MDRRLFWLLPFLALAPACGEAVPAAIRPSPALLVEWPAQRMVYVADSQYLRVFRIGTGLAPMAERPMWRTPPRKMELVPEAGRLRVSTDNGQMELDAFSLKPASAHPLEPAQRTSSSPQ